MYSKPNDILSSDSYHTAASNPYHEDDQEHESENDHEQNDNMQDDEEILDQNSDNHEVSPNPEYPADYDQDPDPASMENLAKSAAFEVDITETIIQEKNSKVTEKDFEVLSILGKGGFGTVVLAKKVSREGRQKERDEGNLYAMKIVKKYKVLSSKDTDHTKAERNILTTMDHPFIVKMMYAFQTKARLFLVLEFAQGGELFTLLEKETTFDEHWSRFYLGEIALALGYLHEKNVIYRDIKPENILLSQSGHVKLADFGLCKENITENDAALTFCGTIEYMAPEILYKRGHNKEVDWWSLGILMWDMMNGSQPFQGSREEKIQLIKKARLPFDRCYGFGGFSLKIVVYILFSNKFKDLKKTPSPQMSRVAKHLVFHLLQKQPQNRLGYGLASEGGDIVAIRNHPFFAKIDFNRLLNREITPPHILKYGQNGNNNTVAGLTRNFDFADEPIPRSLFFKSNDNNDEIINNCGDNNLDIFGTGGPGSHLAHSNLRNNNGNNMGGGGGRNNNGERLPGSKYADVFNGFSYVAPLVMASYNKFNEIKSEHNTLASNQLASNTLNDQQPRSYRQMDDFYKKECARSIGLQQPMASNNLNVSKPNMLQIPTSNVGPPAPSVLTNQNPMMNLNGNYQISMTHQNNNNNNNNFLQQPVIANSSQMEPSSNISFVSVNSESNNNNVVSNNGVNNQFYNHQNTLNLQNQQANNHNNLQNHPDSNKLALSSTINSNLNNNNNNNNQITNDTNSKQAFQISNHSFLNLQNSHQNNNFIAHQIAQQQQQQSSMTLNFAQHQQHQMVQQALMQQHLLHQQQQQQQQIQAQAQALAQAQANQPNQLVNQQQTNLQGNVISQEQRNVLNNQYPGLNLN